MLREALHAYELAQSIRLGALHQAQAERTEQVAALQAQSQVDAGHRAAEQQQALTIATAERERLGQLLAAMQEVEMAAHELIEKAGLAHIVGPTVRQPHDEPDDWRAERSATAFAAAQTSYIDLRSTLLRLAEGFADAGEWSTARRVLEGLAADPSAPLHADAATLLRETYLRPARNALQAQRIEKSRHHLLEWLQGQPDDGEARSLLLQPARDRLSMASWEEARRLLEPLANDPMFPVREEAASMLRSAYLEPARAAVKGGAWDEAHLLLDSWLQGHESDQEFVSLGMHLLTSACAQQDWSVASRIYLTLERLGLAEKVLRPELRTSPDLCFAIQEHVEPLFSFSVHISAEVPAELVGHHTGTKVYKLVFDQKPRLIAAYYCDFWSEKWNKKRHGDKSAPTHSYAELVVADLEERLIVSRMILEHDPPTSYFNWNSEVRFVDSDKIAIEVGYPSFWNVREISTGAVQNVASRDLRPGALAQASQLPSTLLIEAAKAVAGISEQQAVACSPDGRYLAIASADLVVHVFRVRVRETEVSPETAGDNPRSPRPATEVVAESST